MTRTRRSWKSKLRPEMRHEIAPDAKGRGQMLFPTPLLVAEEIAAVPSGSLVTISKLRWRLARRFGADLTCPLMTGIFFNIVAGAAEEDVANGRSPLAPYWRVVLDNGTLSPKTPDGPERHAERLRAEGHIVTENRAKFQVADFEVRLVV